MRRKSSLSGFTLLEIMISVAVVGILVAVAFPLYRNYQTKARASDIVVKYDAVRSSIGAELAQGSVEDCADLSSKLNPANFRDPYARLGIGFEKASDGYRAVFAVCAELSQQGALGVGVAREAHGVFARTHGIEKGAVLTESLASFAVPIAIATSAVCRTAPANPPVQCGLAAATTRPAATAVPVPTQPTPAKDTAPVTCGPGQEKIHVSAAVSGIGKEFDACAPVCPAGTTRNAQLACVPVPTATPQPKQPQPVTCSSGERLNSQGTGCETITCPSGQRLNAQSTGCETITCPSGQRLNAQGSGCETIACPSGQRLNAQGSGCETIACPSGQRLNTQGTACVASSSCPTGMRPNPQGHCVPDNRK